MRWVWAWLLFMFIKNTILPEAFHNLIITVEEYILLYRAAPTSIYIASRPSVTEFFMVNPTYTSAVGSGIRLGLILYPVSNVYCLKK